MRRRLLVAGLMATIISPLMVVGVSGAATQTTPVLAAPPASGTPATQETDVTTGSPESASSLGVTVPPEPPQGVNLTTLSDSQLAEYGLPPRPASNASSYSGWEQALSQASAYTAPSFASTDVSNSTQLYSSNWSGYQNYSGPFYQAQGGWTIPNIYNGGNNYRYSSSWVGLGNGGSNSDPITQAGFEVDTYPNGGYNIYPWWEYYSPSNTCCSNEITSFTVSAHDSVFVEVWIDGSDTGFYVEDVTSGKYADFLAGGHCTCSTAEVIEERPTVSGSLPLMTILGATSFSNAASETSSGGQWMGNAANYEYTMYNPGDGLVLAYPSTISNGNFTVTRANED